MATGPLDASIVRGPVIVTPWEQIPYGVPAAFQVVEAEMVPQTGVEFPHPMVSDCWTSGAGA
jgi:hypothetical protein